MRKLAHLTNGDIEKLFKTPCASDDLILLVATRQGIIQFDGENI